MKNLLKKDEGFTLVELMVVVAIIGLLSAVALPNFKKYQAKSKVAEAKLQLSAVYTAESAFFSDYNIYATCLNYMGYDPRNEASSRYFAVGFNVTAAIDNNAWTSAVNSGLQSGTAANNCSQTLAAATIADAGGISFYPAGKGVGSVILNTAAHASHLANTAIGTQQNSNSTDFTNGMTFRVGAAGVVDGSFTTDTGATGTAALTIDNNKVVSTVRNGY